MRTVKIIAAAALLATWGSASAVSLTLIADNTRSSSGTLSHQVFQTCTPASNAAGTGCSTFTSGWQVANGVTGSTGHLGLGWHHLGRDRRVPDYLAPVQQPVCLGGDQ
jgi:hypothetical protein